MRRLTLRIIVTAVVALVAFCSPLVAKADNRSAQDYMERGIRAAYDNMHLVYKAYYDDTGKNLEVQPAGHVAIWQEWDKDWNLLSRTYLGPDGEPVNRIDGYAKMLWEQGEDGSRSFVYYDVDGNIVQVEELNTAQGIAVNKDGWSDWMKPKAGTENECFRIGFAELGDKDTGDVFLCELEIEFSGVSAIKGRKFLFRTQGAVDGLWQIDNIWGNNLIFLIDPPECNTCVFNCTGVLTKEQAEAEVFELAFRCDCWGSGKFRVRNVKVIKQC